MKLIDIPEYQEDIRRIAELPIPWNLLQNRSVLISGATGLLGSFLIDVLMYRNNHLDMNCSIVALSRSRESAEKRFGNYREAGLFRWIKHDINFSLDDTVDAGADYIVHLASNTHPVIYATDPIGTITTNLFGTYHLLNYAVKHHSMRFLLASSNEIYGENRGDVEKFCEDYLGYIDCNTLRAGYPESKRCAEALCQAYRSKFGLQTVVARLTRSYGPTMKMDDSKALSQFIVKSLRHENIILKSAGTQYYSFTYYADAVSGLLTVMLKGKDGEAYNIADEKSDIMLKDLAQLIADISGTEVRYEIPEALEASGYSIVTKARLDSTKLQALGWNAADNIESGINKTLIILNKTKIHQN